MRTYILQKLYNSNTYILHCRNVLSNMGICISKSLNRVNFSHCIKGNILGNTKTNQYTFLFRAICEEKAMQMQIHIFDQNVFSYATDRLIFFSILYAF